MRTEEIILRLFCMVDNELAHVNKREPCQPVSKSKSSRLGSCSRSKGSTTASFIAGSKGIGCTCFRNCRNARRGSRLLAEYDDLADLFLVAPQKA
jgi:hypothetical protein